MKSVGHIAHSKVISERQWTVFFLLTSGSGYSKTFLNHTCKMILAILAVCMRLIPESTIFSCKHRVILPSWPGKIFFLNRQEMLEGETFSTHHGILSKLIISPLQRLTKTVITINSWSVPETLTRLGVAINYFECVFPQPTLAPSAPTTLYLHTTTFWAQLQIDF